MNIYVDSITIYGAYMMNMVPLFAHVSRKFLLNLSRLWATDKAKQRDMAVRLLLSVLENQPHQYIISRTIDEILNISHLNKHYILDTLKLASDFKLPKNIIEPAVGILWSFGLLDFEVLRNRILARTTRLWTVINDCDSFKRLDPRGKVLLALLSGLIFNTPAKLIFKFIASGVRSFDELYSYLSSRVLSRSPKEVCSGIEKSCITLLESLSMVERPLTLGIIATTKKISKVGINELIIVGLSAIGSIKLNLPPRAQSLKPPYTFTYRLSKENRKAMKHIFTAPEVLVLERDVLGTIQDYGLGISEELQKAIASANPYQNRPENLKEAMVEVFETLEKHQREVERDLKLVYSIL